MVPLNILHDKIRRYEEAGLLNPEEATYTLRVLEQQCKAMRDMDAHADGSTDDATDATTLRLSRDEMQRELERREHLLRSRPADSGTQRGDVDTDQWRIYVEATSRLKEGRPLRMFIQASTGTGKSFLLTTLYLWCELNGLRVCAGAPTGIAAANIEIAGTSIHATTIHNLLKLNPSLDTNFDFERCEDNPQLQQLIAMDVLFVDEYSMIDVELWTVLQRFLIKLAHVKREHQRKGPAADEHGSVHILIFGDAKHRPPATSMPPFLVLLSVHKTFYFSVMRQF